MIRALILKDLRQHRKSLLALVATALVLSAGASAGAVAGRKMDGVYGFAFGFLVVAAPIVLTMWFIGHEKVKETIRVLRLLPISPRTLMGAKMIGIVLVIELLLLGALVLTPALVGLVAGQPLFPPFAVVVGFLALPLLSISVMVPLFIHYDYKIAGQVAFGIFFGASTLLLVVVKQFPDVGQKLAVLFSDASGLRIAALLLWLFGLLALALGWFVASRIYEWKEWSDLGED
jgi:ABC-type transport system involved in multi-copper enzyme maturation permease subunit